MSPMRTLLFVCALLAVSTLAVSASPCGDACSQSFGSCMRSCSNAPCIGEPHCLDACRGHCTLTMRTCNKACSNQEDKIEEAKSVATNPKCVPACKLADIGCKAICDTDECTGNCDTAEQACELACQIFKIDEPAPIAAPGPVTPPACLMNCHKGEYARVQACNGDATCIAGVKAAVASCAAACPASPSSQREAVSTNPKCVPACKLADIGCKAICDTDECTSNCDTAEQACELACQIFKAPFHAPAVIKTAPVQTSFKCKAACKLADLGCKAGICDTDDCSSNCDMAEKACELACDVFKAPQPTPQTPETQFQSMFSGFVKKYNKKYTADEFFSRYAIFKANVNKINNHNKGQHSYTMAVNEFADMTFTEFHAKMTGYKRRDTSVLRKHNTEGPHSKLDVLASSVDWRQKNAVTPVKNQQQCGSCWAFSTTGSTEGAHAIKTGDLVSLSEQQLVDCSAAQGNQGCNGGMMDQGFQYIISNGGITTEDAYPYTATQGTCQTNVTVAATLSSFVDVTSGSETALMQAVNIGPVSVAIEADQQCFQFYSGGVLSDPSCGTNLDHGVLVVGYGTDNTVSPPADYWIVKNSWGESWGEQGYIRLARGSNECGIATEPSYPVVGSSNQ